MKRILIGIILLLAPSLCRATTVQLTGTIMNPVSGEALNGSACFQLPVNATDTSTNKALTTARACFPVGNGVLPVFASVTPNDVIQPANTYYVATFYDRAGATVLNANYSIPTGGGTFNIGAAVATTITTSNISYLNPALTNISQVWTAVQTFLTNSIAVNELVPGANGQFLQTVGGVAVWGAAGGTTLQVNGGATSNSVNLGNLPAAASNNILGVWQYSAGNASVEIPATGTGTKAVSGTGTYNSGHGTVIDANGNVVDSGVAGATVQRVSKTASTCTPGSGSSFDNCTDTLVWPVDFIDNAYTPVCTGVQPAASGASGSVQAPLLIIGSHTAHQVVVITQQVRSIVSNFTEIHCIGVR